MDETVLGNPLSEDVGQQRWYIPSNIDEQCWYDLQTA